MKNKLIILISFTPLGIGLFLSWLVKINENIALPFFLISLIFLVIWTFIGSLICKSEEDIKSTSKLIHSPTVIALILCLFQEYIIGHYLNNMIGVGSLYFFLPTINLSYILSAMTFHLLPANLISYILMRLAYSNGYKIKKFMCLD